MKHPKIPVNRHPFHATETAFLTCQYKDNNISKLVPDHLRKRKRRISYVSKVDCPAKITVRRVTIYEGYVITPTMPIRKKNKIKNDLRMQLQKDPSLVPQSKWIHVSLALEGQHIEHPLNKSSILSSDKPGLLSIPDGIDEPSPVDFMNDISPEFPESKQKRDYPFSTHLENPPQIGLDFKGDSMSSNNHNDQIISNKNNLTPQDQNEKVLDPLLGESAIIPISIKDFMGSDSLKNEKKTQSKSVTQILTEKQNLNSIETRNSSIKKLQSEQIRINNDLKLMNIKSNLETIKRLKETLKICRDPATIKTIHQKLVQIYNSCVDSKNRSDEKQLSEIKLTNPDEFLIEDQEDSEMNVDIDINEASASLLLSNSEEKSSADICEFDLATQSMMVVSSQDNLLIEDKKQIIKDSSPRILEIQELNTNVFQILIDPS